MSKSIPFLHRRGDTFCFRIAIPSELRRMMGCREFTKSLKTPIRSFAEPIALELAAFFKRLFYDLRLLMAHYKDDPTRELKMLQLENKMRKMLRSIETREAKVATVKEVEFALMKFKSELFDSNFAVSESKPNPKIELSPPCPKLSSVIKAFLEDYDKIKHAAMFKKYSAVLPMFLQVVGDKPISELKQSDVNDYFKLIQYLPPRWADACRKNKVTVKELAQTKPELTINEKTFDSTYIACVRAFLNTAITNWQDQGFPANLTTSKINYRGKRLEGENRQRPFTLEELRILFNSKEMTGYFSDPVMIQRFWFPLTGLYSGARVNEICQINPQTDIKQEKKSCIWYFDINETTEGDERIKKSTKNKVSRRLVPIHSELIKKGFLTYFEQVKESGAKLLFPLFKPSRGKASGEAEKWFREFLKEIGLRDDTPENKIVGMHAFRSTFSNAAMNVGVDESQIVGHVGSATSVARGYRRDLDLKNKQKIIEQIIFDI